MSWDISVMELPEDAKSVADIADDFQPGPLARRDEIINRIRSVCPNADFANPTWGRIDGDDHCIEVNLGKDEMVTSFMFHVRGGEMSPFIINEILSHLGYRGIDVGSGEIFRLDAAEESYSRWRAYRDQVIGKAT